MKTKDKITEEEIIHAIRQVGEDAEIIEAFKSVSEQELREMLEKERYKNNQPETKEIGLYPPPAAMMPSVARVKSRASMNHAALKRSNKRLKFWLYTAVSIAAVFLVILMLNVLKTNSYQDLYAAKFEMPEGIVPRSGSDFFDLYNKGRYKEALSVQETSSEAYLAENYELKFYVSVCYMYKKEFRKAIQYLSELHKAVPDRQDVQWYLALCYLKQKETDKAIELLQNINNEEYADKSKEILEKLK